MRLRSLWRDWAGINPTPGRLQTAFSNDFNSMWNKQGLELLFLSFLSNLTFIHLYFLSLSHSLFNCFSSLRSFFVNLIFFFSFSRQSYFHLLNFLIRIRFFFHHIFLYSSYFLLYFWIFSIYPLLSLSTQLFTCCLLLSFSILVFHINIYLSHSHSTLLLIK